MIRGIPKSGFTRDLGNEDVHPSLIALLDVIQLPIIPAAAPGFGLDNIRGRIFHVDDPLRSLDRRSLVDREFKMIVINVFDKIFGVRRQALIKILIVGMSPGRCTTGR